LSAVRDIFNLHDSELSKARSTYKARVKNLSIETGRKEAGYSGNMCVVFGCSKICTDVDWVKVTQDRIQWRLVKTTGLYKRQVI